MFASKKYKIVHVLVIALLLSAVARPATIEIRIQNGDDDAEQLAGGAFRDATSSDLELAYEDPNQVDPQTVGLRFTNIPIPHGADIISAYVQFQPDETKGGTEPVNLIIDGELNANPLDFDDNPEIEARPRTITQVSWAVPNWTTTGVQDPNHRTSDIAALIQELINQPDWTSGNAIVLIFQNDPENPSLGIRCAESRDGSTTGAPLLHVEFTSGSASNPQPPDGQTVDYASIVLAWTPGDFSQASRVYFSDSLEDVQNAAPAADKGLTTWTTYPVSGLLPGTTYYWRIDEVNDTHIDSPWQGEVWSFATAPENACNPYPADNAINMRTDLTLTWDPGMNMVFQNIFLGTDYDAVLNAATPTFFTIDTAWQPVGLLDYAQTYYWRIDTHDACGQPHQGDIWTFSTVMDIPISDPNLIGWWTFDEQGPSALDWSGHENRATFVGDPNRVAGYDANALELDGDDFIRIDPVADDFTSSNLTLSAWVKTADAAADWFSCNSDNGSDNIVIFAIVGGQPAVLDANNAYEGLPTTTVNDDQWHMLTYIREGDTGYIYIDAALQSTHHADFTLSPDDRWSVGQEWDDNDNPTEFLTGLIDDVRIYNRPLTPLEIKRIMVPNPDAAWNPNPVSGRTYTADSIDRLTWSPGERAVAHDVYFGTDAQDILSASTTNPLGVYQGRRSPNNFDPLDLELGRTYYWRIDEVNPDSTITKGIVWSFDTAEYLIVDDFETYVLWSEPGNHVFEIWLDGIGNCDLENGNDTGAIVTEHKDPPGPVLEGAQSMKYDFDNDGMVLNPCNSTIEPRTYLYSRTEAQVAALPSGITSDWESKGVKAMEINFHGTAANALTESLWVRLKDSSGYGAKVFYGDAPGENITDVNEESWHVWDINLADLTVDLADVVSITIAIGDEEAAAPGGSGTIYIDDIRLYIPRFMPEKLTPRPADYDFDGDINCNDLMIMIEDWLVTDYYTQPLVLWYQFEGTPDDSGPNGFDATLVNAPVYTIGAGSVGYALNLDGTDQYANTNLNAQELGLDGNAARTFAAWVMVRQFNSAAVYEMGTDQDGREFTFRVRGTAGEWRARFGPNVHQSIYNIDTTDTWAHFAHVFTGGQSLIYLDGNLISTMTVRLDTGTGKNLRIGRWNDNYFDGAIDDFRVYDKALSQAQITALMTGTISVDTYHPVPSPMNLVDPEPQGQRAVNFADFAVLAANWLEKQVWPEN
ncbi:MAG: hypothetical protein JW720_00530 [Sedimentisphaerales bacterium]|nr:hypothetical protein [Sedimentisphaerales bacterium]